MKLSPVFGPFGPFGLVGSVKRSGDTEDGIANFRLERALASQNKVGQDKVTQGRAKQGKAKQGKAFTQHGFIGLSEMPGLITEKSRKRAPLFTFAYVYLRLAASNIHRGLLSKFSAARSRVNGECSRTHNSIHAHFLRSLGQSFERDRKTTGDGSLCVSHATHQSNFSIRNAVYCM